MTPRLLRRWEVDYLGRGENDPPLTVEQVWTQLRHIDENVWEPNTPEAADWETRKRRERRDLVRAWTSKYPLLKPSVRPSKRRLEQPRLKPTFETFHDITLRLSGTYIFIGSDLYHIVEIRNTGDDYLLIVADGDGNRHHVLYNQCPEIDLRTPEPQYIQFNRMPVYLCRRPSRSQRQGINSDNTMGLHVGTREVAYVTNDSRGLIRGISNEVLVWNHHYSGLMRQRLLPSMRLSKYIATYIDNKDQIYLEYKNRVLGPLRESTVVLDDDDSARPWIRSALSDVGCNWAKA